MFKMIIAISLNCILLAHSTIGLANDPKQMLAVVQENADYVDFYHPKTGKRLGEVKVGFLPHEIAITNDGKTAYVSNFGIRDYDSGSGIPGNSISVIDIPQRVEKYRLYTFNANEQKEYAQIDSAPHGVKLRPPFEKELFVNIEKGNKMLVFDVASRKLIRQFDINPNTHNLFFSQDGKTLWLMAGRDGIIRMDPETGKVTGSLVLSTPVRGLKYTPDQRFLLASAAKQVVLVDPEKLTIHKEYNNLGVNQVFYSDMSPNGKYIVAPAAFDNQIVIIDAQTGNILKRLVTGLNPLTALISPSSKYVYVTNATDKHITKINLETFAVTNIKSKEGSNSITFAPYYPKPMRHHLTLGVALPLTGSDALKGRDMMRGYEFWRLMVTRAGGLFFDDKAYDINIIYLDTQSEVGNMAPMTKELIEKYKVSLLLSTAGEASYYIEKQIAAEHNIAITPVAMTRDTWLPNTIASGEDYFVTTKAYNDQFLAYYNFKASQFSATATALGISLQKALQKTDNMDAARLEKVFNEERFAIFYPII